MLGFPFLIMEQHTTFKESIINRLSNLINRNHSVLCSNIYMLMVMMIVLIVVPMALNMTITTWWQRCWWQWQEWVLNRPNLTGAVLPAHMWPRGFSLFTFAFLSLPLIELASMWYFCNLPPVFTEDLSDGKFFVAIVFFSKRCDNDVSLTHAAIAIIVFFGFFKSNAQYVCPEQSGRKCVSVAAALRAEQGPWEPIKDCIREIGEQ